MVPKKKGKRIININHEGNGPEEPDDGLEFENDGPELPSALNRAMDKAGEAENEILKQKIVELEEKTATIEEELNRERAKLQNIRRRADEDIRESRKYGAYDLAFDLLNILDCLEMGMNCNIDAPPEALKPYIEGVDYTVQELMRVLRKNGIEEIATDIPYDPELHQVFECIEEGDSPPGTILKVNRKGYKYHDRVLRTALVVIAGAGQECPVENGEDGEPAE